MVVHEGVLFDLVVCHDKGCGVTLMPVDTHTKHPGIENGGRIKHKMVVSL